MSPPSSPPTTSVLQGFGFAFGSGGGVSSIVDDSAAQLHTRPDLNYDGDHNIIRNIAEQL